MSKDIVDRLKEIRGFFNESQTEFAKRIGDTNQLVADLECGRKSISRQKLQKYHEKTGFSIHWILTGKGDRFVPEPQDEHADAFLNGLTTPQKSVITAMVMEMRAQNVRQKILEREKEELIQRMDELDKKGGSL